MARKKILLKRASGLLLIGLTAGLMVVLDQQGELERPAHHRIAFSHGITPDASFDNLLPGILSDQHLRGDSRLVVTGHTGTRGEEEANRQLSRDRAELIAGRLVKEGVPQETILTLGVGGSQPLERREDESERSYQRRLPRVDIVISKP